MKRDQIIEALNSEIDRLTNARDLLLGAKEVEKNADRDAAKPRSTSRGSKPSRSKRRAMSAEGKARIAAAQRKRWAKQKDTAVKATKAPRKADQPAVKATRRVAPTTAKATQRKASGKVASKKGATRTSAAKPSQPANSTTAEASSR